MSAAHSYEARAGDTSPPLDVEVTEHGRVTVAQVTGEVDIATVPRVALALGDHDPRSPLVLDLSRVTFMSSSGLGLIASLHRRLSQNGALLALSGLQPIVARLLEVAGLTEALLVASDVPAAIDLVTADS